GSRPIPPVPEHATRAVLVLEQYAHLARVDVREAMYQSLRSEHRVIRFPSLVLMTLWPFACVDRRPRANPSERYPWGDSVAIEVASMGLPRAEIFQRYMDVSAAKMPDLDKLLTYDREVMKRCEKVCDVNMADVIFARMRTQHLFWTWRYVSGILMRELILRLVEHGQDVFGDLDATSEMHVNTACMMEQAQTDAQFPIHPLVAERLGLTYIDAAVTYRWFGHRWTFEEYMTRYIALDPEW
ncbi:MAG TPA: WcbI family polysaccharide biosynthesis putative acetyltransferase, partial [Candidatus Baltobacteraceae bacterium]